MAFNILEILTKCERRLSKRAKRIDIDLEILGQDIIAPCETEQSDEWQRLFIAIIQLHIESYQTGSRGLHFELLTDNNQVQLIIDNISTSSRDSESYQKLHQTSQLINEVSLEHTDNKLELSFSLDSLGAESQSRIKHILCADDNPDNRQIIKALLEKMGHKVSTAENGELALQATLEQEFDLIFLDIQMPVMDGMEALELMRSTACETPVIAFTAQVFDHEVSQLLELGFNAWLAKPIDRQKLNEILATFLDNQASNQDITFDADELAQMKMSYQEGLKQYVIDLQSAAQSNDIKQIARLAHALKGSGGNFGFDDITQIAGQLEQTCYQSNESLPSQQLNSLLDLLNKYKI